MSELQLDRAGRRRSPATMPGFHAGRAPRNKGLRYPADPPKVEEIVAVMRAAGDGAHGRRLRGLIVILWRAGLRIQEALALTEADLDQRRGSLLVRRGRGGRRREVGMETGAGGNSRPGSNSASNFRSVRCSASSAGRPAADPGQRRPPALSSDAPRPRPASTKLDGVRKSVPQNAKASWVRCRESLRSCSNCRRPGTPVRGRGSRDTAGPCQRTAAESFTRRADDI